MIIVRNSNTYIWLVALVFVAMFASSCASSKKIAESSTQTAPLQGREKVAFDETFFNGLSAKYAGDYKSATVYFKQCLTINPNSVAVKYELSTIYIHMGYNENAIEMAEAVIASEPDNIWYLENVASVYQNTKEYKKSAEVYEKLLTKKPNEVSYYYELGSAYLYINNAAGAINTYENLQALTGFENSLAEQLYKLYEHQGMDAKAEEALIELINHNPTEIRYVSMLAAFYKKSGETQKAVNLYERLKKEHPNDPYVKLALYEYYHELGQEEEAFNNLEAAFRSTEVNIDSKVGILLALMDVSVKDAAVKEEVYELMDILTEAHPNNAKTWAIYGDFLYGENKKAESRSMFLKSIEIDNSKYQVWNQVLFIDSELNEVDSIIAHSKSCIELFPNQVLPHYFNGIGHVQKQEFKEGIKSLENAKEFAYGMPDLEVQIMANLGDAYYQVGEYQKSWFAYDHSLRMNPSNDYVLNNYAFFLGEQGEDLDKALEMSKRTVDEFPLRSIYLDTYGWILFKMENYSEAVKYLSKAVQYDTFKSSEILEHLGDAQYKSGDIQSAVKSWQAAKESGEGSDQLDDKIKNKKLAN